MSIRLMTKVWDSGEYAGGTLIVLLALCDFANDSGTKIFPYLETLAEKARLSVKQVRRTLETLIEDGVIIGMTKDEITKGQVLNMSLDLTNKAFRDKMSPAATNVPAEGQMAPGCGTSVTDRGTFAPAYIDNPSSEPPREPPSNPPAIAGTGSSDLERAVQAFNQASEKCPKWTSCRDLTANRKKVIGARLAKAGLAGWQRAVTLAASSGFLGGPVPTSGDHKNWRMDIAWFAKEENFTKISEGKYPPGGAPAMNSREASRVGLLEGIEEMSR